MQPKAAKERYGFKTEAGVETHSRRCTPGLHLPRSGRKENPGDLVNPVGQKCASASVCVCLRLKKRR